MPKYKVPIPERQSLIQHKRDVNLKIYLPIILVTLMTLSLVGLLVFTSTKNESNLRLWADISIIWLIEPALLMAFIFLIFLIGLVYGLSRLIYTSPRFLGQFQVRVFWLLDKVRISSNKMVKPLITFKTWMGLFSKSED